MAKPPHHHGQGDPKNRPWNRANPKRGCNAALAIARLPNTPRLAPALGAPKEGPVKRAGRGGPPIPVLPLRAPTMGRPANPAPTPRPPKPTPPTPMCPPNPPPTPPPRPPPASAALITRGRAKSNPTAMLMPQRVGFSIADRNTASDWPCLLRESCADMNILTVLYRRTVWPRRLRFRTFSISARCVGSVIELGRELFLRASSGKKPL